MHQLKPKKPPRFKPTSMFDDFQNPDEAKASIRNLAKYMRRTGTMFDPPPGIRACRAAAMKRALAEDIALISAGADYLTELKEAAK